MEKLFYTFLAFFMVLGPFFLFRKSSVHKIRSLDNFFFKWLISKNKVFGCCFHWAKFFFLFIGVYFLTQVSIHFFAMIFQSKNSNFLFAFFFFVAPYLFFLYIVINVLTHIYLRKFVYLDEIFKIFLLDKNRVKNICKIT